MNRAYAMIDGAGPEMVIRMGCIVENTVVLDPVQVPEMESAFGKPFIPCLPLGLVVGDYHNGAAWTRNVDGIQTALPIEERSRDVDEILDIIEGRIP